MWPWKRSTTIDPRDSLSLQVGRDINIRTTTTTNRVGLNSNTRIDRVAALYVTNPGGTLVASAGHDVNLVGAIVSNHGPGGLTSISAKNDIHLQTVRESSTLVGRGLDNNSAMVASSSRELGTSIAATGSVTLDAGRDVTARAATVTAGDKLSVQAGRDITIESGRDQTADAYSAQWSGGGLLSRGSNAMFTAGEQVNVHASNLSAGQTLDVTGREVNIYSGINQRQASYGVRQSNSGLGATALAGRTGTVNLLLAPLR